MKRRAEAVVSLLVVCLAAAPAPATASALVAQARLSPVAIDFSPAIDAERFVLSVATPRGDVLRREFAAGQAITFSIADSRSQFPDGDYRWELTAAPRLRPSERAALDAARATGDANALAEAQRAAGIPDGGYVQSGAFRVAEGAIVDPGASEAQARIRHLAAAAITKVTAPDVVFPDDVIIQGSSCVGLDCVNNENFGFDTIRLKENNTRIHFDDTSTSAGFPANDWRLIANDSASGGSSKFSIEDSTGAKTPFTITAGAATNSIFADSTGRIGLRTSTPVLDLHIATSNTPAIRLEQNNSGGFTAQTWDIGANEANFFVRDVTGGSKLSFRIRPGAPTSSIDISADGDVGVGTASPSGALHVSRNTGAVASLLKLTNNSGIQVLFDRTDGTANDWQMSNFNSTFQISVPGASPVQFSLNSNGNLTIGGTQYLTGSSRDLKEHFVPVDAVGVLRRVAAMPLNEWNEKLEPSQRHIGPVAEDWWAAFGLGPDDKHVAVGDVSGVALAAIKGLSQVVDEKSATITELQQVIAELQEQNRAFAERLQALEARSSN